MITQYIVITQEYFNFSNMKQLKYIMKSATDITFYKDFKMNEKYKQIFLDYKFTCLKYLNLDSLDIDDDFIKRLCKSGNLKNIRKINLCNNPKITSKSIYMLNENQNVCCEGHGLIISGKYGRPITEIEITINDVKISTDEIHDCQKINWDFNYHDLSDDRIYSVIKTLNIRKYPIYQYDDWSY